MPNQLKTQAQEAVDLETFADFMTENIPRALALVLKQGLSNDDAEEVVQESFVKAYFYLLDHAPTTTLATWVLRVAANIANERLRKQSRHRGTSERQAPATTQADRLPGILQGVRAAFERALTEDEIGLILLRFVEGRSVNELALESKRPAPVIEQELLTAQRKLQRYLVMEAGEAP